MRIAASGPDMWLDIFMYNRQAIGEALRNTEEKLDELRRALETGDVEALRSYLRAAQAFRQGIDR
jgi:cyclohexadieny/prephenate dehydrogenase